MLYGPESGPWSTEDMELSSLSDIFSPTQEGHSTEDLDARSIRQFPAAKVDGPTPTMEKDDQQVHHEISCDAQQHVKPGFSDSINTCSKHESEQEIHHIGGEAVPSESGSNRHTPDRILSQESFAGKSSSSPTITDSYQEIKGLNDLSGRTGVVLNDPKMPEIPLENSPDHRTYWIARIVREIQHVDVDVLDRKTIRGKNTQAVDAVQRGGPTSEHTRKVAARLYVSATSKRCLPLTCSRNLQSREIEATITFQRNMRKDAGLRTIIVSMRDLRLQVQYFTSVLKHDLDIA